MPNPDRLLNSLRRAIDLTASTPGTVGRLLRIPEDAVDVLILGDLHGHVANFQAALNHADLQNNPGRHLILQEVIHGPYRYDDGSDKSHQVLDLFAALKCQFPYRVHLLPGNHELAQWTNRPIMKGEEVQNESFRNGVTRAYGPKSNDIYRAYLDLLTACPLAVALPNRVWISHSVPSPKYLTTFQVSKLECGDIQPEDTQPGGWVFGLLWGRDTSESTVREYLQKCHAEFLVSGHIPCDEGFDTPSKYHLILDSSARPAACVLVPTRRSLTFEKLVANVRLL